MYICIYILCVYIYTSAPACAAYVGEYARVRDAVAADTGRRAAAYAAGVNGSL